MGYKIGMPFIKLNRIGQTTKANGIKARNGSLKAVAQEALQERLGKDKDIDKSKTADNIYMTDITSADELEQTINDYCKHLDETAKANGERALRKDAVVCIGQIFKPSNDFMATLNSEQQIQFLKDCYSIFEDVSNHKMVAGVIHLDEQVAHLHCFWLPTTEDGKLNAKKVNNKTLINKINREMPKALREKGWDISDCSFAETLEEKKQKAKECGKSSAQYKREQQEKIRADQQLIKEYTPSPTIVKKNLLGKEKEIPKSEEQLKQEQLILMAQQILKQQDEIIETANKKSAEVSRKEKEIQNKIQEVNKKVQEINEVKNAVEHDVKLLKSKAERLEQERREMIATQQQQVVKKAQALLEQNNIKPNYDILYAVQQAQNVQIQDKGKGR